ncbi:MAG: hypothetical protein QOK15_3503 [Nocardioidaceae bacterium]|nr:hypothetical protein [Nocardioidaceae bacterium]
MSPIRVEALQAPDDAHEPLDRLLRDLRTSSWHL